MITIAIAEDHQSLIDGIELLLKYNDDFKIVGTANDGERLIEIVNAKQPDVVLVDIRMPKIDGIQATKIIKASYPDTKIVAFTMFDQDDAVKQMLDAGAEGYLLKDSPLDEVLNAITAVMKGEVFYDKSIDVSLLQGNKTTTEAKPLLSKSERDILALVGLGKTSSEISEIRHTSVSTVEKHRKNMIRKLGLSGRGELLRYALESKYDF